jgi:hypothetical protein
MPKRLLICIAVVAAFSAYADAFHRRRLRRREAHRGLSGPRSIATLAASAASHARWCTAAKGRRGLPLTVHFAPRA